MNGRLGRWAAAGAAAMALLAIGLAPGAHAQAGDPAAAQIAAFDDALLATMKDAKSLGVEGRYHKLEPAVARAFDAGTMIRFAVGPGWSTIPAAQQAALTTAFERLTVAGYAKNFSGYSGETFVVQPNVVTRGPDKLVTTVVSSKGQSVTIAYRMREIGGSWKIIDVFYNGSISQLTTRRSDFAAAFAQGGAAGLLAHLNALADKDLKG
ncbi:MAG TPA: ABC transporter substrate-binding protein [Caulobacteraceae bacterium]